MTTRYPQPDIWVVKADGTGIEPLDWRKYGFLDLEPDNDTEPEQFPLEVASVLGFDPMDQSGTLDAWKEEEHPRGQPENAGEFAKVGTSVSTVKKKMTLTEARQEVTNKHATLGSKRRAADRLREEIAKLRKLPHSNDVVNLVKSHKAKLDQIEDWISSYGGETNHASIRKIAAHTDWYTKKELDDAVNWVWDNIAKEGTLSKADEKLLDKIRDAWYARVREESNTAEKRREEFAFMSFEEVSQATGIEVTNKGGRRGPGIRVMLSMLPERHLEELARNKVKIEYVEHIPPMPDNHPWSPGLVPAGLYNPSTNTAQVADEVKLPDGSSRLVRATTYVLRHEIGHAIDRFTGLSYNKKIREAYWEAIKKLTPDERKEAAYWLGDDAPEGNKEEKQRLEMYAELYAYAYGQKMVDEESNVSFGGLPNDRRSEVFGPVGIVVREETDKYLYMFDRARETIKEEDASLKRWEAKT